MGQDTYTTPGSQSWTVPSNVTEVALQAWGAAGGAGSDGDGGALGGYAEGTLSVTPGETLEFTIGGAGGDGSSIDGGDTGVGGSGGTNGGGEGGSSSTSGAGDAHGGGGGGGATDVRQNGTTLSDRVLVGAGGAGEGGRSSAGGAGGASVGEDGSGTSDTEGHGGTQSSGGAAGDGLNSATAGSLGTGGNGDGSSTSSDSTIGGGGGGGAGYYGGGGGDAFTTGGGGGGGGSNYVGGVSSTTSTRGVSASNGGDGKLVVSYVVPPTLDALAVSGDQIDVTFTDNATGEDEYQILVSTDGGSTYTVDKTVGPYTGTGQHTETTTNLLDGEEYTVKVRAVSGAATADSGTLTATTEVPDITGLSLDASVEDEFTASWDDVSDNGEYRVEHRETGAASWTSDGTVPESDTDIVIGGLEDGEQYDVRVRAETTHAIGDWTSVTDATKLPAPTDFSAQWASPASGDAIDGSWTDRSDNPDESFDILYRVDGSGSAYTAAGLALGATATSGTVTGLQEQTTYELKARVETEHVYADSSTDTATTGFTPAAGGWVALRDASGATRQFDTDLTGLEATREHTALSDWRAVVAYDESLEDWTFSEAWVYDNTELLVRGEVIAVESTASSAETELQGYGELYRLEQIDTEVSWDSAYAYEAMRQVVVDETPFDANLTTPSSTSVSNIQIASEDGASALEAAAVNVSDTDPVRFNTTDDNLELAQSGWIIEAEGPNASYTLMTGGGETGSDPSKYSGDTAIDSGTDAGGSLSISFDFTTRYDIPTTNLVAGFRIDIPHDVTGDFDVKLDGTVIGSFTNGQLSSSGMINFSSGIDPTAVGTTLSAGTHTLTWEVTDSNYGDLQTIFDCAFLYDDRWNHTYPGSVSSGVLDAPELYPDEVTVEFQDYDSTYNLTSATLDATWHLDSEGTVGLSFDGGGTWTDATGTDTVTAGPPAAPATSVRPRVTLTRRTDDPNTSPASGDDTDAVFDVSIEIDGNTLGVIDDETFEGNVLQILQRLAERGDLRFVMEYSETGTSTIAVFKAGDVTGSTSSWVVRDRSRAVDVEGYANKVVVRGGEPASGSRPKVTLQDDAEIAALGKAVTKSIKKPDITDVVSLRSVARTALASATAQDSLTGSLEIAPTMVDPGKSYQVPAWSATLPAERVRYGLRPGSLDGAIDFRVPEGLGSQLSELGRREQETRDAL